MKKKTRGFDARGQRRAKKRLAKAKGGMRSRRRNELCPRGRYSVAERVEATPYGGVGVALRVAERVGLPREINERLHLLKVRRPYSEADHVLNIAANALSGGESLQDIERRRNDMAFLDMLGARAIPDPTTAGDFCRRLSLDDVDSLNDAINESRLRVWQAQGPRFTNKTAVLDVDSTLVTTTGECKEGMELNYKGTWGYHPLLVTYANTNEPLYIVNRRGARPSVEGAPALLDKAIALCRRAGHEDILLRGDTAFTMTRHLDAWHKEGVRFVFGILANHGLIGRADALEEKQYAELRRCADEVFEKKARAKQPRVKQRVVEEKGYKDLRLEREDVAEFDHKPTRSKETYRIVALRKTILEHRGQLCLGNADRYFFYITNDRTMSARQVVREANQRCAQEKLIGELKSGVRALRAPLNTLEANAAFMVAVSLAWSLKAWAAMMLPVTPRWRKQHSGERNRILRMSFRSFVQELMLLPVQVVRTGRRIILRVLGWRPAIPTFFRLAEAFGMT